MVTGEMFCLGKRCDGGVLTDERMFGIRHLRTWLLHFDWRPCHIHTICLQDNVYKIIKRMRGDGMLEEDAPSGVMAVSPDIRIVLAALSREPSW